MATAKTCRDEERAVDKARDFKSDQRWLSKDRRKADDKLDAAKDRLKACKKENSDDKAIIMARGMARAAADAKVKFPLKKNWHKDVGIGKKDNEIEKKLKLKNVEDAVEHIKKFGKDNDLNQAAGNAVALEALYDLRGKVAGGFVTAQIALAIMDIVATVLSLGTYATFAPAIHGVVGKGGKVTLEVIQKDINAAEAKYANALQMRQDRIDAKRAQEAAKKPISGGGVDPSTTGRTKPGGAKKGLLIGGAAAAGLLALSVALGR